VLTERLSSNTILDRLDGDRYVYILTSLQTPGSKMMGLCMQQGLCHIRQLEHVQANTTFCIPSPPPPSSRMPSERYAVVELPYHVQENIAAQPQAKLCAYCHATLVDATTAFHDNQVICAICRERPPHPNARESSYPHRQRSHDSLNVSTTRRMPDPIPAYDTVLTEPPYVSFPKKPPAFTCNTIVSVVSAHRRQQTHYVTSHESNDIASNNRTQQRSTAAAPYPSPLADITRLRIRSCAHQCLYAGAVFQGTQKSGRNSYDVYVTIVVS